MAFCRVILPLLVLSVAQCFATVDVPVFLWGDLGRVPLKHDALSSVPFNEFGVMMKHELQEEPFTVVFIEPTLSVEDFALKTDGKTVYPFLRSQVSNAVYLPSVESPLRVLNKLADPESVNHVRLTEQGPTTDITSEDSKFLFISLEDATEGESRPELLKRHNDFMEDMFKKLQERYEQVVAVYTAKNPSWTLAEHSRVRRQAEGKASNASHVTDLKFQYFRIYFGNINLLINNTNDQAWTTARAGDTSINGTQLNATLNMDSNTSVTLNFENNAGYWLLNSATLLTGDPKVTEQLKPTEEVYALINFSYRCSNNITFATANETTTYSLTFQNIRIQPFLNTTNMTFGDMYYCTGFFTAPIWAGLFVVTILLTIMFYGVVMMMDIKTMDRFDDPKGKTITINTSE